jgi:hypothetical protein
MVIIPIAIHGIAAIAMLLQTSEHIDDVVIATEAEE